MSDVVQEQDGLPADISDRSSDRPAQPKRTAVSVGVSLLVIAFVLGGWLALGSSGKAGPTANASATKQASVSPETAFLNKEAQFSDLASLSAAGLYQSGVAGCNQLEDGSGVPAAIGGGGGVLQTLVTNGELSQIPNSSYTGYPVSFFILGDAVSTLCPSERSVVQSFLNNPENDNVAASDITGLNQGLG
jgi:hypothetical protein